ncbi:golgin candidate 2 [Diospyros lotus]|uniref:golgin candidate 2 n=1 Tax=Diospyros lotus TaxID=55363 RepID=UPI00225BE7AE|nr:golgin candidate 2 [Diospyros lotus]
MANWISSKLKVAESFLQQIDQQAAESLGKNEKPRSEELSLESQRRSNEVVPLKDQLTKKKKNTKTTETIDLAGKLRSDHNLNLVPGNSVSNSRPNKEVRASAINVKVKPSLSPSNPKSGLTDSDWTELLSSPSQPTSPVVSRNNGVSGVRGIRKDSRRQGSLGPNLPALEGKRNQMGQNTRSRSLHKSEDLLENDVNGGRHSDGENSRLMDMMQRNSKVELGTNENYSEGRQLDLNGASSEPVVENKNEADVERNGSSETFGVKDHSQTEDSSVDASIKATDKEHPVEAASVSVDGVADLKMGMGDDHSRSRSSVGGLTATNVGQGSSTSLKRESPSVSDGGSDSETSSTSSSDSESQREREERKQRRAQILAEKAAAKAVEAVKERENVVARLEGEKQSLEKIVEERAKQQAREASELQNSMMEMMEAAELEKQKHNNTRMEVLARLAKLETANADLARSLATAQWKLEVEINRLAELRQQIELKEASHEEIRRKISATHDTGSQLVASKGVLFEREILETELSFVTEKIGRLQEKAKTLEANIEMTRKDMENPTEVEFELKRRLGQLTDHLIRKQAQVEALSSEKATLLFRIEAVSRLLDENKAALNGTDIPSASSSRDDIESATWEFPDTKLGPLFDGRIRSGREHLGSLVRQLDSVFCAGSVFLRRNSSARLWSLVYLVCLHLWVIYIIMSHSPIADETTSGAVFSLENINKTTGGV